MTTPDLKPGRELDALIAEKVFGLTAKPYETLKGAGIPENFGQLWIPYAGQENLPYEQHRPLPAYSTDIAAAWEVQDAIRYKHGGGLLTLVRNGTDTWFATFDDDNHAMSVTEDTAPHAICRAALKAVEGK